MNEKNAPLPASDSALREENERCREALERIVLHDPKIPGLHFPSLELVIESAVACARAALSTSPSPVGEPADWREDPSADERWNAEAAGSPAGGAISSTDVRWAVNYLLETIAKKFEANDTWDIWRSDAAELVRSHKHADVPLPTERDRTIEDKT